MNVNVSPPSLTPPKNLDEAHKRLDELKAEVGALNAQLGQKNVDANGRLRLPLKEWQNWRNRLKTRLQHKLTEQRELKQVIHDMNVERRRVLALSGEDTPFQMWGSLFDTASDLKRLFRDLTDELARVQHENTALRNRLLELDPTINFEPPTDHGHDDWRQ